MCEPSVYLLRGESDYDREVSTKQYHMSYVIPNTLPLNTIRHIYVKKNETRPDSSPAAWIVRLKCIEIIGDGQLLYRKIINGLDNTCRVNWCGIVLPTTDYDKTHVLFTLEINQASFIQSYIQTNPDWIDNIQWIIGVSEVSASLD